MSKIALVLSPTWSTFHAASPNLNLIHSSEHKEFQKFVIKPSELENEAIQSQISSCRALVVDYANSYSVDFYKSGPRFLIWGDDHCHSLAEVRETEFLHARYDYVLAGTPHALKKTDKYFYVSDEAWGKRLYFPHFAPDQLPGAPEWSLRKPRALLPSNTCPHVYRFRWLCGQLAAAGAPIDDLPHFQQVHANFLKHIGSYQYAITCNSHEWLNYTVAKYFEMPAMGAVTIATPLYESEALRLGFEHMKNIIFTKNHSDVLKVMDGSIACDREAISKAGTQLILKYHTSSKRLDYLAALIRAAKGSSLTASDSRFIFEHVRGIH